MRNDVGIMKNSSVLDNTATLRSLIKQKYQQKHWVEALVLARLGVHYCSQNKNIENKDETSYVVFKRYLELMPHDEQIREALAKIGSNTIRRRSNGWLIVAICLTIIATLAIAYRYYAISSGSEVPELAAVPAAPSTIIEPVAERGAEPVAETRIPPVDQTAITVRAVGDIVIGSSYPGIRLPGKKDMARITALRHTLRKADIVLGNLEGVLLDKGKSRKNIKQPGVYSFRMPENYASILKTIGFDALSLANNHVLDFGQKGLQSTISNLKREEIIPVGTTSEATYLKIRNTHVALLAYSYIPGPNYLGNTKRIRKDMQKAKAQADIIMVSVHAGKEGNEAAGTPSGDEYFLGEYRGNILKFSEFIIDEGAAAVFGHGPHIVRPYRLYKGKPVFYSLGNFIGYKTLSTRGQLSHSVIADLSFSPDGKLTSVGIIPLKLDKSGIPIIDYSSTNLKSLEVLLESNLIKDPVLELKYDK